MWIYFVFNFNLIIFFIFFFKMSRSENQRVDSVGFAFDYFNEKGVKLVTTVLCDTVEFEIFLWKEFSQKGIKMDILDLDKLDDSYIIKQIKSTIYKIGVILDLKCHRAVDLLELANKNELLTLRSSLTFWYIMADYYISFPDLQLLAQLYSPKVIDPVKFLTGPYDDPKNIKYLLNINIQVNYDFLMSYKPPKNKVIGQDISKNQTKVGQFLQMEISPDSEIILVVPNEEAGLIDFYKICKATVGSKPEVSRIEVENVWNKANGEKPKEKPNLNGGLLRAGSAIFQPEAFTRIDDLATRESDLWSKMSHGHVKLLAEDLNFRIIIRFFDDYGWQTNGTFGHLMGFLQQKKADLSAAGLLMRMDRFGIVDFLHCPFRLQTGILFREPSLSSVSNIFLLPFSKAIWISIVIVILLTVTVMRCRAMAGRKLVPSDKNISNFFDIGGYIMGVICQQGFSLAPQSITARTAILVLLLTSVALFTSYSACIVALLQSSSSAILSISDITKSDLDVGIQANFPLYKVMIREANHPVLKNFYQRKVLIKGEKAYFERRQGIEKMRTGLFAFEVELTAGYKLISETYEEREKCGIKEIDLMPKPFICMAVTKDSPYKEIFTQRLVWQNEAGLFDRTWKLWVDQKPKCEVGRIGFISVGLTEFRPAIQVFVYGIIAALAILLLELLHSKKYLFLKKPKVQIFQN